MSADGESRFCTSCGERLSPTAKFCASCGASASADRNQPQSPVETQPGTDTAPELQGAAHSDPEPRTIEQPVTRRSNAVVFVFVAATLLLLVGGAAGAYFLLVDKDSDTQLSQAVKPKLASDDVALVGNKHVTQADFNHWASIARMSTSSSVQKGQGTGYVYVPPVFASCVQAKQTAGDSQSVPILRRACQSEFNKVKGPVMQLLITSAWIRGQAEASGITLPRSTVVNRFTSIKNKSFKSESAYQDFLESSGQTEQDVLARVEVELLSQKIRDKAVAGPRSKQKMKLNAFVKRFQSSWKAKTLCASAYSMELCQNSKSKRSTAGTTGSAASCPDPQGFSHFAYSRLRVSGRLSCAQAEKVMKAQIAGSGANRGWKQKCQRVQVLKDTPTPGRDTYIDDCAYSNAETSFSFRVRSY